MRLVGLRVGASMRPRVFPAEDPNSPAVALCSPSCFNEAAGIPRGRPPATSRAGRSTDRASMRPRVFPAEDAAAIPPAGAHQTASMRPRVFPAEDYRKMLGTAHPDTASMRPRVFPAEDPPHYRECGGRVTNSSMRPRVFPAEDDGLLALAGAGFVASMRPRVFPAEDSTCRAMVPTSRPSFNEAAGIPRGSHYR